MQSTAEVTAGDIARLAGVGRAAVSNWRKRYDDFPHAVGGTAASPVFRLTEVEEWLIANGRMPEQSGEDRLWRALQHSSIDPEREIPAIATTLLELHRHGMVDNHAQAGVVKVASEIGPEKALKFLVDRFIDLRGRRGPATTSVPVADLMVELGDPAGKAVLDPACRAGSLLAAAANLGAASLFGQDADADNVTIAAASLGVAAANADIRHGTLRDDAFPDAHADVVLSDPPTGGNWGFDELAADMRWEYSTPPRTETELAWVQHALARLRPGGTAILLLPPGVAERTAGRRIRRELVRRGALEAIIALPSGATPPHNMRLHMWVMCRPLDRRTAREVLMVDAQGSWDECLATIRGAMSAHADSRPLPDDLAGRAAIVEAVGLVGEDVDLTPSRHISSAQSTVSAAEIAGRRDQLLELLKRLPTLLPPTTPGDDHSPAAEMTVGDLAKAGLLTVHPPGETPIQAGDVLVPTVANRSRVVVATGADDGRAIGPQFTMLRVDPRQLDPWFIAGYVFADANLKRITSLGSIPRVDVRKAQIPRLPLERQRGYGEYLRRLHEFADLLQSAAADGEEVVHMVTEGLVRGTLGSES